MKFLLLQVFALLATRIELVVNHQSNVLNPPYTCTTTVCQPGHHNQVRDNVPPTPLRQGKRGAPGRRGEKGEPCQCDVLDEQVVEALRDEWTMMKNNMKLMEDRLEKLEEYKVQDDARISKLEADLTKLQNSLNGVCPTNGELSTIYSGQQRKEVYCDMETDGGRWIVFQRRMDGSIDFYRNWDDYVSGFGNKTGEFWLGLDLLHELTSEKDVELRIDLEDWEGNKRYAKYSTFQIGDASSVYKITVGGYTGDAGDSFSGTNGMKFTTKDRDSDTWPDNCAIKFKGAWWYKNCHSSNLNGFYFKGGDHKSYADGVDWATWKTYYYSMKFTEMKIRPIE